MPLSSKGQRVLNSMIKTYGSERKAKQVLFASKNKGTITGIDAACPVRSYLDACARGDCDAIVKARGAFKR